jgi:hypothetical protein
MPKGFVYILVSPYSNYIKIGGTERPIGERLKGINGSAPYADHGPWGLSELLHVTDWQLVESSLHRHFHEQRVRDITGTRELFNVPPFEARKRLRLTDAALRIDHEKTEQLLQNVDLKLFLFRLFQLSGLFGNLDIQGAWVLSFMPSTVGGRWFTLNIGSHEVAFSGPCGRTPDNRFWHSLVLDRLILEYPETIMWIEKHGGEVKEAPYARAVRAVSLWFREDFANAEKLFKLPGVRRALIAYWSERLADLRERNVKSVYARHHSYNVVAELLEYKRATEIPLPQE